MKPNAISWERIVSATTPASSKGTVKIPFLTVFVTASPAKNAPANSNIAAIITACFNVNAREPTEVPIAFATSLAPIFQAI